MTLNLHIQENHRIIRMALLFPGRPLRSLRQRWCYLSRFIFLPFLRFRHLHTLQPSCGNPRWSNLYRDSDSEPSQRRGLGGPARKRRPHSTGPWTGQVQHGYCLRHVPWYRVGLLIFKFPSDSISRPRRPRPVPVPRTGPGMIWRARARISCD